jgi:signal transduction histidine kinase
MTAIVGWTQFLRANAAGDEMIAALEQLENGTVILRRLVDDLLEASRAASGKLNVQLHPTVLAPIIGRAVDLLTVAATQKQISLDRHLDNVLVAADEVRIEQIVTNLLTNAIKFTPAGGRVGVSASRAEGYAEIVVSDTGPGIPADLLPHIFEPFTQADAARAHGGLGLGLSIVKHLVEAHDGTISVRSVDGRGTTFVIRLPALDPETVPTTGVAAA